MKNDSYQTRGARLAAGMWVRQVAVLCEMHDTAVLSAVQDIALRVVTRVE